MLLLLGITLFLSAFLLFCCEPMIGKMVLPILGGTASVWTTCVLFFQIMLLAGYVYTHLLGKFRNVRHQIMTHAALMLLAFAFLPLQFSTASGSPSQAPIQWLLIHLFLTAGLPFTAISATAPLLQNWLTRTPATHGRDPYFLYALSNAGSLIALMAYPLIIEPTFGVTAQSRLWFYGYVVLFAMVTTSAISIWNQSRNDLKPLEVREEISRPLWKTRLYWLGAAFLPSALMLAVTSHMALNVGSMPFLWVIPLGVYLLTFILAFARRFRPPTPLVSAGTTVLLILLFPIAAGVQIYGANIWLMMSLHVAILFMGSLLCHSSLADRRPPTQFLTEFYFIVALGGALGGIFNLIVAPALFSTIFEYPLLIALIPFFRTTNAARRPLRWLDCAGIVAYALLAEVAVHAFMRSGINIASFNWPFNWAGMGKPDLILAGTVLAFAGTIFIFRKQVQLFALGFAALIIVPRTALPPQLESGTLIHIARNFFGVKKVIFDPNDNTRTLLHGDTIHGRENLNPDQAGTPRLYYYEDGPMGDLMALLDRRPQSRVAVVGLGTGTIGAYAKPNRHITFIDIDPQIVDIAYHDFSFIRRCGENCDVVVGDGRLALESAPSARLDLIILDAFNSDSIPAHLISREAVRMYLSKLRPDGALLFHVSNRYLDVATLAAVVARDEGLSAFIRDEYVIAFRNHDEVESIRNRERWLSVESPPNIQSWTDDYSNLVSVVRWR